MSEEQKRFKILEEKIPFGERVAVAIQQAVHTACIVVAGIFLLPVNFIRTIFTTKRRVIELNMREIENSEEGHFTHGSDDDEDWKKAHYEEYGE